MKKLFPVHRQQGSPYDKHSRPFWDFAVKHGTSRKKAVEWLCSIGGYYDRGERFAIEFNIAVDWVDLRFDTLKGYLLGGFFKGHDLSDDPEEAAKELRALREVLEEDEKAAARGFGVGAAAVEDAWRAFVETDEYRTIWTGEVIPHVEVERRGRGGKHLVLAAVADIDLRCSPEELHERLMDKSTKAFTQGDPFTVSSGKVLALYLLCVHYHLYVTRANIKRAVEDEAMFRIAQDMQARLENNQKDEELAESMRYIINRLQPDEVDEKEALRKVCERAGLTL